MCYVMSPTRKNGFSRLCRVLKYLSIYPNMHKVGDLHNSTTSLFECERVNFYLLAGQEKTQNATTLASYVPNLQGAEW